MCGGVCGGFVVGGAGRGRVVEVDEKVGGERGEDEVEDLGIQHITWKTRNQC